MTDVTKRLLVVGPGGLGMARARCLRRLAGVELAGVVSRTPERAAAAAAELEVPTWGTDLEAVVAQARPDAAVIAATNRAHHDLVARALRQGLDVFVEGPMCTTAAEAESIVALAAECGRLVEVGFQRRYHPTIQRAHQAVRSGAWGALVYGEVEFFYDMRPAPGAPDPWYLDQQASGGMAVCHLSYGLNTLRYVLGDPVEVFAAANNLAFTGSGQITEDTVVATLLYASGAVGHIVANFSAPPRFPTGVLKAHGTAGGCALQILEPPCGSFWNRGQQDDVASLEGFDDLQAQCEAFVKALRGRGELLNPPQDSLRELRLIESALKSARLRTPVVVPQEE